MRKDDRDYSCRDCRAERYRMFMVHDHVWNGEAGLPSFDCLLCMPCLERRIGRPLVSADFTVAPLNWWPRWGTPLRPEPTSEEMRAELATQQSWATPEVIEKFIRYAEDLKAGRVCP